MYSMSETQEMNAVVTLYGKKRLAGRIYLKTLSPGITMWVIETPETSRKPAITRLYSPKAIYSITPVEWDVVLHVAKAIEAGIPSGHPMVADEEE